jgi:D-amino peptidase
VHVLISADMEGATGITWPGDVEPGAPGWQQCRPMLTGDVNAAVAGFYDAGAHQVTVNEAHATMRNLQLGALDERAVALVGRHKRFGMMEGIADGVDAVAFIGYHAGAGRQGVLSHTVLGTTILQVLVNGAQASEGAMNALLAAEFGVPLVLVTGDDSTCEDATVWAPGAQRVVVKQCVDRYTARCFPPAKTSTLIREAASRSLSGLKPPERPEGPFTYEIEFDATNPVTAATAIPGVTQAGERRIAFTLPTMAKAIRCFKAVTVLAAASVEAAYG